MFPLFLCHQDLQLIICLSIAKQLTFDGEVWENISDDAKDLISRMLERNVSSRITAEAALRHPWIFKHHVDVSLGVKSNIVVNGAEHCNMQENESVNDGNKHQKKDKIGGQFIE